MNVGTYQNQPPGNTIPSWLLSFSCISHPCTCLARLKPDILIVKGLQKKSLPPEKPTKNISLHFIEFTFCHDRLSIEAIIRKKEKYNSLIESLGGMGWQVPKLHIISVGVRGGIHRLTISTLETIRVLKHHIHACHSRIHQISIQYMGHLNDTKRELEASNFNPP